MLCGHRRRIFQHFDHFFDEPVQIPRWHATLRIDVVQNLTHTSMIICYDRRTQAKRLQTGATE